MNMSAETTPTISSTQPTLTDEEWNARLKLEEAAFIAMHPQLLEKYEGKYVAIYGGQLIDVDDDYAELYDRVLDKYRDETPIYFQEIVKEVIPIVVIPCIDVD